MGVIRDLQREHARQAHAQQRAQATATAERQRIRRNADLAIAAAQQATKAADQRQRRRLYAEARAADVAAANADLRAHLDELDTLLLSTLAVDDHIDLDRFKKPIAAPPFDPGPLGRPLPEPAWDSYAPPAPTGLDKVFGARHQQQVEAARRALDDARARHAEAEAGRQRQLAARREEYEEKLRTLAARITAYNAEVDRFAAAVAEADPDAVVEYFGMVLGNSVYPESFPQRYRLAYLPHVRELVVEYQLPPVDVIPAVRTFRYDRATDDMITVPRDPTDIAQRYPNLIAQVTLRTVHEIVEADRGGLIETVSFNGIVDTVDRRTGQETRPCLVSLRADREVFAAIKLRHVDPVACLRHLRATLSSHPEELEGVTPLIDLDRVDTRYRDEVDVLADLDQRPNLLALSPPEFASLIADLLTAMGLETGPARLTDARVEWVAVDPRPLLGGVVVVHAMRGGDIDAAAIARLTDSLATVSGTKGILVTTGRYAAAAQAAAGLPVELIDGADLLTLLAEQSRVEARIYAHTPA